MIVKDKINKRGKKLGQIEIYKTGRKLGNLELQMIPRYIFAKKKFVRVGQLFVLATCLVLAYFFNVVLVYLSF